MRNLELVIVSVEDPVARDNFDRIQQELARDVFGRFDGRMVEITFSGAVTNYRYPHNLGFLPVDVIQTRLIGVGALTWNYALFSRTHLDITTTGACSVRAFVGSYVER